MLGGGPPAATSTARPAPGRERAPGFDGSRAFVCTPSIAVADASRAAGVQFPRTADARARGDRAFHRAIRRRAPAAGALLERGRPWITPRSPPPRCWRTPQPLPLASDSGRSATLGPDLRAAGACHARRVRGRRGVVPVARARRCGVWASTCSASSVSMRASRSPASPSRCCCRLLRIATRRSSRRRRGRSARWAPTTPRRCVAPQPSRRRRPHRGRAQSVRPGRPGRRSRR